MCNTFSEATSSNLKDLGGGVFHCPEELKGQLKIGDFFG